ncbi:MAG: zinc-binding dehydrogenase [Chloroflexi bacterium]|nr:zinc-binding dehydrogenase [Chloroflexota bacterium]
MRPIATSSFVGHNLRRFLSKPNSADLLELKRLAEAGQLRPAIDQSYPLTETPAALHHIATGHARGKVVVTV